MTQKHDVTLGNIFQNGDEFLLKFWIKVFVYRIVLSLENIKIINANKIQVLSSDNKKQALIF